MKKLLINYFLMGLIGSLMLTIYSCEKVIIPSTPIEYELPPETQIGAETLGFILDGDVWVPRIPFTAIFYKRTVNVSFWQGSISIFANREFDESNTNDHFSIYSDSVSSVGLYSLKVAEDSDWWQPNKFIRKLNKPENEWEEYTLKEFSYYIFEVTRYDIGERIISGRFEMDLYNQSMEKIEIRQGRFDLKF